MLTILVTDGRVVTRIYTSVLIVVPRIFIVNGQRKQGLEKQLSTTVLTVENGSHVRKQIDVFSC